LCLKVLDSVQQSIFRLCEVETLHHETTLVLATKFWHHLRQLISPVTFFLVVIGCQLTASAISVLQDICLYYVKLLVQGFVPMWGVLRLRAVAILQIEDVIIIWSIHRVVMWKAWACVFVWCGVYLHTTLYCVCY